ncbi:MAG: EcsC family protein, partial [Chitinophagaceae bacterium]
MEGLISYNDKVSLEVTGWKRQMLRRPGMLNKVSKKVQDKINSFI